MNKQPEQTAKTRQTLINAFWELAHEVGIDKVTVSAVTKRAKLNRGTFYAYFTDMPDLLAQAEDDIIHEYQHIATTAVYEVGLENSELIAKRISEAFYLFDDKFFLLIGKNGDPDFRAVVQDEATKMFRDVFAPICDTDKCDYYMAYITSAAIGMLNYWHEKGRKISVPELVQTIYSLATQGIMGTIV